ncbi:MAG: hypothetical protein IT445_18130 [Phycisphaeraceae bacterium]|nr:hypothetical protein [Phycisphaeraceae bacterium]
MPQPTPLPGGAEYRSERRHYPDGTVREKRWTKLMFIDATGMPQVQEIVEIIPPLTDGIVPKDDDDVLFCTSCTALVCKSMHSFQCAGCAMTYCFRCRVVVPTEDGDVGLCPTCAQKVKTPMLVRIIRRLAWGE